MSKKKYVLKVSKSLHHVYATLVDDNHNILAESSTLSLNLKQSKVKNCFEVGQKIKLKLNAMEIFITVVAGARDAGLI